MSTPHSTKLPVSFNGGVATISGVLAGYQIEYTTTADHNRVLIENGGSGKGNASADFDIGGFDLHTSALDKVEVGSKIIFEDDGPALSAVAATSGLQVDETTLATDDTADFSVFFTPTYGADGAGRSAAIRWASPRRKRFRPRRHLHGPVDLSVQGRQ